MGPRGVGVIGVGTQCGRRVRVGGTCKWTASTRQEADGRPANCRCYDVTAAMTNSSEDAQPQHAEQRTALAERC